MYGDVQRMEQQGLPKQMLTWTPTEKKKERKTKKRSESILTDVVSIKCLKQNIRMRLVNAGGHFDTSTYLRKISLMHSNDAIL